MKECFRFALQVRENPPNVVASQSTRGFPPGPVPSTPAGRTAGLLAENLWWLRHSWHDDSESQRRRRRLRDLLVALAKTGQRRGRVRGRPDGSRLLSRHYVPRRGTADRLDLESVGPA